MTYKYSPKTFDLAAVRRNTGAVINIERKDDLEQFRSEPLFAQAFTDETALRIVNCHNYFDEAINMLCEASNSLKNNHDPVLAEAIRTFVLIATGQV